MQFIWSRANLLHTVLQVLGTPTREEIRCMNPNYTDFRFPQIKAHPWHKVCFQLLFMNNFEVFFFFFCISFSHTAKILGILLQRKSWWSLKHHNFACIIWYIADFHSIFRCFRFSTRECLQKQLILHHGCCNTHQVSDVQRWVKFLALSLYVFALDLSSSLA